MKIVANNNIAAISFRFVGRSRSRMTLSLNIPHRLTHLSLVYFSYLTCVSFMCVCVCACQCSSMLLLCVPACMIYADIRIKSLSITVIRYRYLAFIYQLIYR